MKKIYKIFIITFLLFAFTNSYALWWAEVKCNVHSISKETSHLDGTHIFGKGSGKTRQAAVKAAQKDANDNYRVNGTHIRHCDVISIFNQKYLLLLERERLGF